MKTTKLNQSEIDLILKQDTVNSKKDVIQDLGVKKFKESGGHLICTWTTSTGKTIFAIKLIKRFRLKTNAEVHIVVPFDNLKTQWESQLIGIENVKVFILNSYYKEKTVPFLLIVDEVHYSVSNSEATSLNKINDVKAKYRLYLSATLKKVQLDYLQSKGFNYNFNIGVTEGDLLGLFPPFQIYNLYVDLTYKEKQDYKYFSNKEIECKSFLIRKYYNNVRENEANKLFKSIQKNLKEEDKGLYFTYIRCRNKRLSIILNAENKLNILKEIIPHINRKTILFSKTINMCKELHKISKQSIYHSGQKTAQKHLDNFLEDKTHIISSVNKLIAGFDDASTDLILRHSFDSSALNSQQTLGKQNLPK